MLIISNGAFKSGSTWLFNILREISHFPPPPKEYLNDNVNPSIEFQKLQCLLVNLDFKLNNYLVKNHFFAKDSRDLLLENPDIFIVNIERDIRDVLVSTYYHFILKNNYTGSFKKFYWGRGRYRANRIREYHAIWDVDSLQIFKTHYETLKTDFNAEIQKLGNFLGFQLTHEQILIVEKQTSLKTLREKYGNTGEKQLFFRRGVVGDWENHMTSTMLRDLNNVYTNGLNSFDRSFAGKLFFRYILPYLFPRV